MRKLFFVIIFTFSLFADAGEEIGVPSYPSTIDMRKNFIESAVLSSDGKSFYTLQGQDLIHWNLSPLKKLEAWAVPLPELTVGKNVNRFHSIYLLENETKVLITSMEGLMIYDLQTRKVEKETAYSSYATVKDGDLLYLTHLTPRYDHDTYDVDLEVWQLPELKRVRTVSLSDMTSDSGYKMIKLKGNLMVGRDVIYYFGARQLLEMVILDKKSLTIKEVDDVYNRVELTADGKLNVGRFVYRFDDGTKIWDNAPDEPEKVTNDDKKNDEQILRNSGLFYGFPNLAPSWSTTLGDRVKTEENVVPVVDGFHFSYRPLRASCVGNLCLRAKGNVASPYIFLKLNDSNSKKQWGYAVLLQSQGEMVIKKRRSETFEATSPHMKLLQMRTADGKIVPMNEATFKKYNQPMNIGVQ